MNCSKCGHFNSFDVSFCEGCGAQIVVAPPPANPRAPAQPLGPPTSADASPFGQPYSPFGASPSPYAAPGYDPYASVSTHTSGLAIAGFICAFLCSLLGLVLSIMALNQIRKDDSLSGEGLALAGIILSIAFMLLGVLLNLSDFR